MIFTLQEPLGSGQASQASLLAFFLGGVLRRKSKVLRAEAFGSALAGCVNLAKLLNLSEFPHL